MLNFMLLAFRTRFSKVDVNLEIVLFFVSLESFLDSSSCWGSIQLLCAIGAPLVRAGVPELASCEGLAACLPGGLLGIRKP